MKITNDTIAYIAGPMRGKKYFNFPLFYKVENFLISLGYLVTNPAREDESRGFDPEKGNTDFESLSSIIERDFRYIMDADVICMLPGWEDSVGATAEFHIALWAGKGIYFYYEDDEEQSIHDEESLMDLLKKKEFSKKMNEGVGELMYDIAMNTPLNPSSKGERDILFHLHKETSEKCFEVMKKKNHDYAGEGDTPYRNFEACEVLNIDSRKGILLRIMDKIQRMVTFID